MKQDPNKVKMKWKVIACMKSGGVLIETVEGTGEELGEIRQMFHLNCIHGSAKDGYIQLGRLSIRIGDVSALEIQPKKGWF